MEPTVKEVMTTRVVSVPRDASFQTMAAALRRYRVSAFPVLDDDGKVTGVVSEADMLAKEALKSEPQGILLSVFDRPDGDIRAEIRDEVIKRGLSTDPAGFTVVVKDGIVTLGGVAETSEFGHDMVERVRHVQGVVTVRDRLIYPRAAGTPDAGFDILARFPID